MAAELTTHLELTSATLLELVAAFGSPHHVTAEAEHARELMQKVGGAQLSADKIEQVISSAQNSIGVACLESERAFLMTLAWESRRAQKEAQKSKKRVEELSHHNESAHKMSEVVGKKTAALLVSELGEPHHYDNAGSYVKAMGLNLKEHSSGKHKGKLKITKRGSSTVRMHLYMAALRFIQKDGVIGAWYEKKVKRDGGVKMKALVAVMRKLARALWYVARGDAFDSRLLFDVKALGMIFTCYVYF